MHILRHVPDELATSPRRLDVKAAAAIADRVAGQLERVGVFQDAPLDQIESVLRHVELERIQFHGSETPEDVAEVDLPVIKAIRGADREAVDRKQRICCLDSAYKQ